MYQIKVFDEEHEEDLTIVVNRFLSKCMHEIIDIKFSTAVMSSDEEQIFCFSALVIYRID